jgi:hypothetical protein
MVCRRSVC